MRKIAAKLIRVSDPLYRIEESGMHPTYAYVINNLKMNNNYIITFYGVAYF